MAKREAIEKPDDEEQPSKVEETFYFSATSSVKTFSSGCALLDCVLGGGIARGRVLNIVGDKSTGKTLLAEEALANFDREVGGLIRYNEVEAAFDESYARNLGLPLDRVEFVQNCFTVEQLLEDLKATVKRIPEGQEGLYIVDSLDALSDTAELDRKVGEGSYNTGKAKMMSQMFRQVIQHCENKLTIIVISQVRDNIGVTFGEKHTRSGGRALDFYATQILWLSQTGVLKRTIDGIERPIGLTVKGKCKKNKIGMPMRDCVFPLIFGFGVDDVRAGLEWLHEIKSTDEVSLTPEQTTRLISRLHKISNEEYASYRKIVSEVVLSRWKRIEEAFAPKRRKY